MESENEFVTAYDYSVDALRMISVNGIRSWFFFFFYSFITNSIMLSPTDQFHFLASFNTIAIWYQSMVYSLNVS